MQAGDLRESVTLLTLKKVGNTYRYTEVKTVHAAARVSERGTILSGFGMGARAAEMTFRAADAPLLFQAIMWRGETYVVSTVLPDLHLWTQITAAKTPVFTVKKQDESTFPGFILEKYVRWASEKPMDTVNESYILMTPKEIALESGEVISVEGLGVYHITARHMLDPAKNEYEIIREVEL